MAEKHPTKLVAYTPRLDKALKRLTKWSDAITLNEKNPRGKKQSIESSIPVETETETGYNGYFKLIDMTETDDGGVTHYRLGIADGATFDGETSGPSKAVSDGNGRSYDVPFHVIDVPDDVIETSPLPYFVLLPYSTTEGAGFARLVLNRYSVTSFDVQLGIIGIDYEQKKLRIRQHFTDELLHFNIKYEEEFTVSITHSDVYEDGVPKIIICDGMYPESNNCGMTDIISPVPKFTLPKSSYTKSCTLYIGARYDQESQKNEIAFYTSESYDEKPSWANEKGGHGEIAVGYLGPGDVYPPWAFQYYRRGEIIWGREFYIP